MENFFTVLQTQLLWSWYWWDFHLCDHLAVKQIITFRHRVMVLAKEGYGKTTGEWAGRAARQWRQRTKKKKSKGETRKKEEAKVKLLRLQSRRCIYLIRRGTTMGNRIQSKDHICMTCIFSCQLYDRKGVTLVTRMTSISSCWWHDHKHVTLIAWISISCCQFQDHKDVTLVTCVKSASGCQEQDHLRVLHWLHVWKVFPVVLKSISSCQLQDHKGVTLVTCVKSISSCFEKYFQLSVAGP